MHLVRRELWRYEPNRRCSVKVRGYHSVRSEKPFGAINSMFRKADHYLKFFLSDFNLLKITASRFLMFQTSFLYLKVCCQVLVSSYLTDYDWLSIYIGRCRHTKLISIWQWTPGEEKRKNFLKRTLTKLGVPLAPGLPLCWRFSSI